MRWGGENVRFYTIDHHLEETAYTRAEDLWIHTWHMMRKRSGIERYCSLVYPRSGPFRFLDKLQIFVDALYKPEFHDSQGLLKAEWSHIIHGLLKSIYQALKYHEFWKQVQARCMVTDLTRKHLIQPKLEGRMLQEPCMA